MYSNTVSPQHTCTHIGMDPSFSTHLLCPAEGKALDRGDRAALAASGTGETLLRDAGVGQRRGWVADQGRWGPGLGFPQLPPGGRSPWFSRLLGNGPGTPLRKREGVFQSWRHQKCRLHIVLLGAPSGQLRACLPTAGSSGPVPHSSSSGPLTLNPGTARLLPAL